VRPSRRIRAVPGLLLCFRSKRRHVDCAAGRDESRTQGLDRLELIRFLQVAHTITVHPRASAFLLGINALRASEAAAVRVEDYAQTLRGHRVLRLVGKGRPQSGTPIDRRDVYRMVARVAKAAAAPGTSPCTRCGTPPSPTPSMPGYPFAMRRSSPGTPTRTTEHYDRARGNVDRHGVHLLTAYVAGV